MFVQHVANFVAETVRSSSRDAPHQSRTPVPWRVILPLWHHFSRVRSLCHNSMNSMQQFVASNFLHVWVSHHIKPVSSCQRPPLPKFLANFPAAVPGLALLNPPAWPSGGLNDSNDLTWLSKWWKTCLTFNQGWCSAKPCSAVADEPIPRWKSMKCDDPRFVVEDQIWEGKCQVMPEEEIGCLFWWLRNCFQRRESLEGR